LTLNVSAAGTTGVAAICGQGTIVTGEEGCIKIVTGNKTSLQVFTADGRSVCERHINDGISYINVPKGIYIVKVNNSTFKTIVF
jgi:hypothetical protein